MATRALAIAVAAGVLLVTLVIADASMNRTYHLEAQVRGEWVTLASYPFHHRDGGPYYEPVRGQARGEFNASDVVPMRLRVENGHPWGASESFVVNVLGARVHRGTLDAPARGEGEAAFDVSVATMLEQGPGRPYGEPGEDRLRFVHVSVEVEGHHFGGEFTFREASR